MDFSTAQRKYEYEINASTGAVLSFEAESVGPFSKRFRRHCRDELEEAKQAALRHAGVSADSVTFTKTERDTDGGRLLYKLEFHDSSNRYEYKIDADAGSVVSCNAKPIGSSSTPTQPDGSGSTAAVSLEEAKQAALRHAGVSADNVTFTKNQTGYG